MTSSKTLIVIVGPTAIGKTSLSLAFAKAYKTHIISCDSRQFFKEMNIGTAVPTTEELAEAPHHFIQNLSIHDKYSVGDFEKDAMNLLGDLFLKKDVVIMVGGSALYEKAITHGLDDFPDVDPAIIADLEKELEEHGIENLQNQLKEIDPEYYKEVDLENPRRLIRALSIYKSSSITYSSLRSQKKASRPFKIVKIGLEAPREELYEHINNRVDLMLEMGLEKEAKSLYPFKELNALKTVGYQEFYGHYDGKYDLKEAIRLIKRNTRRFAKRQLTWYRKDPDVTWFPYRTRHTDIVQRVRKELMG